ncbi:MAG: DUF4105 domain-containing protein [Deltaproteobacteria bacterium]|nr:DUF4105 domain-containing protein [Deltaproteobacteria bacterium]
MGKVASLILALLILGNTTARADDFSDEMRLRDAVTRLRQIGEDTVAKGQHYPVVELLTMGVGSLMWERHGHIALCLAYEHPRQDTCYNYGIGDFGHPLKMVTGFFRGTNSFYVGSEPPVNLLWVYLHFDRTVWVQPLALDDAQKQQVIAKLQSDDTDAHRYYAYDHFWDNCTTRVRDIIDDATGHALRQMNEPSDGKTYRDLAREGFYGVGHYVPLIITDLAMGRVTDRVPSYWERMFLPDYLREAVQKKFGVAPIPIYMRSQCVASTAPGCAERGAPFENPTSGRLWFVLITLLLTAPAWATRLWGRLQRTGMAIAVMPYVILGTVFWFLAIISPLQYVRWNESCLVFLPVDLVLVWFLSDERRRLYAKGRLAMLGLVGILMIAGVLRQPILYALVWPLVPNAVAAFMPLRTTIKK